MIMDGGPMRSRIALLALLLSLLACGKRHDGVITDDDIEDDLEDRSISELYKQVDAAQYTAPADGQLTPEQIAMFVRVRDLSRRIDRIATRQFEQKAEAAAHDDGAFSRVGTAFSALGSAREALTADLRSAVMLGVNPREYEWVALSVSRAVNTYEHLESFEQRVEETHEELRNAADPYLRDAKKELYDQARQARDREREQYGDAELANGDLIAEHVDELKAVVPALHR